MSDVLKEPPSVDKGIFVSKGASADWTRSPKVVYSSRYTVEISVKEIQTKWRNKHL